ncbi:MAG: hypothetical protein V3V03_08990, partial [Hyphomonadaceae bacterium]
IMRARIHSGMHCCHGSRPLKPQKVAFLVLKSQIVAKLRKRMRLMLRNLMDEFKLKAADFDR